MHLIAAQPGTLIDGAEAVDLGQSPGDLVYLSAADSDLACLASAQARLLADDPTRPSLRLASLLALRHPLSVDLYIEAVIAKARCVVVRVLGGVGYWPYGIEQVAATCRARSIPVVFLPGCDKPDPDLVGWGSVPPDLADRLTAYLRAGGTENGAAFLGVLGRLIGRTDPVIEPTTLPMAGIFTGITLADLPDDAPIVPLIFYRALVLSANLDPVEALVHALAARGLRPLPLYVQSLKSPQVQDFLRRVFADTPPALVLNATSFAVGNPDDHHDQGTTILDEPQRPVLQVVFAGSSEPHWQAGRHGLDARDLAMNVALPEIDGRIITRAVSFKAARTHDPVTEATLVRYRPVPDRVDFVADLAKAWIELARCPKADRRIGFVLANYPNKDGRIGNGVGLDTPSGLHHVLHLMHDAGYGVDPLPDNGACLMSALKAGPTNENPGRRATVHLDPATYRRFFSSLPQSAQESVAARWGMPDADPFFDATLGFRLPILTLGQIAVGLQPSRSLNQDEAGQYHAADLPPPHSYLAFYCWLRHVFGANAIVHMGKHGTLEWLPGKAVALSSACFPEMVLGPLPHLYPFIINDPGEGTQAKRRAQAVIIAHLTPPLARAESYGPLARLESLVDEYFAASGMDPRRLARLGREILDLAADAGLDRDCGVDLSQGVDAALTQLDGHLCDLKEMQIRDGLHVFGQSPVGDGRIDLLLAMVRAPRGSRPCDASLIRALGDDLGLSFDPLMADFAKPWAGPRPAILCPGPPWRTEGDTIERLENLARTLIAKTRSPDRDWHRTQSVLDWVDTQLAPAIDRCGPAEGAGLLAGLDGRFVPPGPAGAPTRGRADILPTGRNFYTLDCRAVPTPAAWHLGWRSAQALIERAVQDHGTYPTSLALSVWGTATLRTGGDDIAQALALMGVRPTWEPATGRVTGFEILPQSLLTWPRVDVTLRVSGFFRDAFGGLIDLFDSAVRAVAVLDEPADINPLAARVADEVTLLTAAGHDYATALSEAAIRIYGAKPGTYGTGLDRILSADGPLDEAALAEAFIAWGGFGYRAGGVSADHRAGLRRRLLTVDIILHNQDNREHDILDSDAYFQFQGGLALAARAVSAKAPTLYHADHAMAERPRIRSLPQEIARVVRGRAANPKWIDGMMRHGYKGAFELAATVDYLYGFALTTRTVPSHHFDTLFDAYLGDARVVAFLDAHNPDAKREMALRFQAAQTAGLWQPRRNSVPSLLARYAASPSLDAADD